MIGGLDCKQRPYQLTGCVQLIFRRDLGAPDRLPVAFLQHSASLVVIKVGLSQKIHRSVDLAIGDSLDGRLSKHVPFVFCSTSMQRHHNVSKRVCT